MDSTRPGKKQAQNAASKTNYQKLSPGVTGNGSIEKNGRSTTEVNMNQRNQGEGIDRQRIDQERINLPIGQ